MTTLEAIFTISHQWCNPTNPRKIHTFHVNNYRLRGMICSTLSQTSADMRDQADRVEEALQRRIAETEEATRSLEDELKAVSNFHIFLMLISILHELQSLLL